MAYPISLLPINNADIDSMNPYRALPSSMSLMKNTLLRALNNIHQLAPRLSPAHLATSDFLSYVDNVCGVLLVHMNNDETFFKTPSPGGVVLGNVLHCAGISSGVVRRVETLRVLVRGWKDIPREYNATAMTGALDFGEDLAREMRDLVAKVERRRLEQAVTAHELTSMIQANVERFASQNDITFLVPFLFSHHDRSKSPNWPPTTPEGREALPLLAEHHAGCWRLAPFSVLTGEERGWEA
ncbi:hypothetical protein HETIRDRAFT_147785 [Heterobasidion irregulare TC 32-1]|uniref:Uncharacterized protein n=1 Tax=Heterobasidion irregulare (strain TC 32-1) TaxID=747525 RepID=W4K4H0_HETIT|nr:uncharacterized protein HETIRDRAFT_147785 [Heterobasidion irregulare TC 32-1]ETW80240.1 hypothetical protein HETIRDRAFT_147785 [Heterobasidion irregulare TC 32-1]